MHHVFIEQYTILQSLIIQNQHKGPMAFAMYFGDIVTENHEQIDLSNSSTSIKGVQIMTIHKSKGLEFPYVILADINNNLDYGNNTLYYSKQHNNIYLDIPHEKRTPYLLDNAKKDNAHSTIYSAFIRDTELAEKLRVYYVAATRAEKMLILSSCCESKHLQAQDSGAKSFLQLLATHELLPNFTIDDKTQQEQRIFNNDKVCMSITPSTMFDAIDNTHRKASNYSKERLQDIYNNALVLEYPSSKLEVTPSSITRTANETNMPKLASLPIDSVLLKHNIHTAFGTYCHFLLNYYCTHTKPDVVPIKLGTQLLPLSSEEYGIFMQSAKEVCQKFLQHSLWKESKTHRVYTEYPFLIWNEHNKVWIRGIIDLLIVDGDNYTIIDYKVDQYKHYEKYKYQLATYSLALQKIFNVTDESAIASYLFYLRSGESHQMTERYNEDMLVSLLCEGHESVELEQSSKSIAFIDE